MTEVEERSERKTTLFEAGDLVAITFVYTESYEGTHALLKGAMSKNMALLASVSMSSLVLPGIASTLAHWNQMRAVRALRRQGAQLSDTAAVSAGLTLVSNGYFQLYHFLLPELTTSSRLFQMALISENLLKSDDRICQTRNIPAFFVDVAPHVVTKVLEEFEKIEADRAFNTQFVDVSVFTQGTAQ